ncbi:hypothetical protein [Pontibacter sp. SGAir0037]|uniref:hypothetical protein n=1 Tax=Pontibacter sp. SGAir0037 TaxID=2571030 RepID=UPI0010CCBDD8|nr:hypothetical protein [Pontibacter sp. SGAir0037]QCR24365.1 hypothetical protein C1N53_19695 [Pontibacter sp. SGAir0037]
MIKTSTQNELIQYVYDELAENACKHLEAALLQDMELADNCSELLLIQNLLSGATKSPGDRAIDNILQYSRSLSFQS